ncbi:MAG: DNA/pantothenate metabolism flavoprotein, partial [Olpidium bornovanus]
NSGVKGRTIEDFFDDRPAKLSSSTESPDSGADPTDKPPANSTGSHPEACEHGTIAVSSTVLGTKPSMGSLLLAKGLLRNEPIEVLIDSGCSGNLMNSRVAAGLRQTNSMTRLYFADGRASGLTRATSATIALLGQDGYFDVHAPPPRLAETEAELARFVERHLASGRRIALVTNQTVRFIDNFSGGTRGATSAEYPTPSCAPTGAWEGRGAGVGGWRSAIAITSLALSEGTLLFVTFVTVNEYLFTLRSAAKLISRVGNRALFYLAAAVSDFYIPAQKMVEHKIQSGSGGLNLQMEPVPKILTPLVNQWASRGFIVSFKVGFRERHETRF